MILDVEAPLVLEECLQEETFLPCEDFLHDRTEILTRDRISTNIVHEGVLASSGWTPDIAEKNRVVNFSIQVPQDDLELELMMTFLA